MPVTVALDAVGGDHAPAETVAGALQALDQVERILLVGPPEALAPHLPDPLPPGLEVAPSGPAVPMDARPTRAVRARPDCSIRVACRLAARGEADAVVTVGHTGAALIAALLELERLPGVLRPAAAVPYFPFLRPVLLIDGGANVDCRPEHLIQFARMGAAYVRVAWGIDRPRVALLSNGTEPGKGNGVLREAFQRLQEEPDPAFAFVGNLEGYDLPRGRADVFVADGLVGNVALKVTEGVAEVLRELVWAALDLLPLPAEGGRKALFQALEGVFARADYARVGAAPLLGVEAPVLIGHGRSRREAVAQALREGARVVREGLIEALKEALSG